MTKQILKANITCWHFPKWYESGNSHGKTKSIEIEIECFQSVRIFEKREVPHLNYYLVLDEKNLSRFFDDLSREILEKYPNVSTIDLDSYSQRIYNSDFSKQFRSWDKVFDIPPGQNTAIVHKRKEYHTYFNKKIFTAIDKEKKPIYSKYIGFTGKSEDELLRGKEFLCSIIFENDKVGKRDYIFIRDIHIIQKKTGTGSIYEYYVVPINAIEQLNSELKIISRKYPGFEKIIIPHKFFDRGTIQLSEQNKDHYKFAKSINQYLNYEYSLESGLTELKKTTRVSDSSNFISSGRYYSEDEFDFMDEDKRFLDDFRADYYSGLM